MGEVWKDIPGFEGYYQVSSLGRVRSMDRTSKDFKGEGRKIKGRIRKPIRAGGWGRAYLYITLTAGGRRARDYVHRLVVRAFLGEIPNGYDVHHVNAPTTDNRLENLAIRLKSYHYQEHSRGVSNGRAKLTEQDVLEIRRELNAGISTAVELAGRFGVTDSCILMIKWGKTWKHLASEVSNG